MPENPDTKTWRDLKRDTPKPVSWRARFRSFMRVFRGAAYVAAMVAVCAIAYRAYEDGLIKKAMTPASGTLKKIGYRTDGRISKSWLLRNSYFPQPADLAEIDIVALKENFEKIGQVKSAKIEKAYPDKVTIELAERRPMARLALLRGDRLDILCMANDGAFFAPVDIPQDELDRLPWITGVPLVVISGRLEPFARAGRLEEFLLAASLRLPENFKTWETVNVREMSSVTLPLIVVTTIHDVKLVFHADDIDFGLKKLEYVLRFSGETNLINIDKDVEKIDLSMRDQAVVSPRKKR